MPTYVNHNRFVEYTYTCLIGTLCHEINGSRICIITMYDDLKLPDFMDVICHEHIEILLHYNEYECIHYDTIHISFHSWLSTI